MKTKLKPATKQKIKTSVKILLATFGMTVSALILFLIMSQPELPSAQSASFNSGNCLTFNGLTTGVIFTDNDLNLSSGNTMSVATWVKWGSKSVAGSWANVITLNNSSGSGDAGQFWLQHNNSNSQFEFAIQNKFSERSFVQSTTNPSEGKWYHVAGVYDGGFINLYVNGILEARTVFTGDINNLQGNFKLVFGKSANSGNSYRRFNGDIDEVSIWNSALTQEQVRSIMCRKLVGNETGLAGYWRMNETSGSVVTDLTSNYRNGTSVNTSITFSGAPVGDASYYAYGSSSASMKDPVFGDSLTVNNFSSAPAGLHIYRIDTIPNTLSLPTGYVKLSQIHYYGIFIVNSTGETYSVTYSYKGHPGVHDGLFLGLLSRTDNTISVWLDLLATLNVANNSLFKNGQTGRNEYIIASKNIINPLPIELIEFNAVCEGNKVYIKWTTASEINNDFFTVERTVDRADFETVAMVKSPGTTSGKKSYSVIDESPSPGTSYYRIKQTDFDGKTESFSLTAINFSKQIDESFELAKAYPNPFNKEFSIDLNCKKEIVLNMKITSPDGKVVKEDVFNCSEGNNTYTYSGYSGLMNGNYIVNFWDASGCKVFTKLIRKE
ncbi:MAG: LamG domain-containing protein [Bacteroidetes bacterium]|nr:LamG domain-containing protein [Bacteroidota bacterium]